jgi:hypothetical protein
MKIRIHHDGSEHGIREESDELLVRLIREGCTQRVIRDASDDELLAAIRDWRVKSQVGVERAEQFRPEQGGS